MGVSRERAADDVEFIRELSETLQQPLGSENDLLLYLQELADLHHLPAAEQGPRMVVADSGPSTGQRPPETLREGGT